MDIRIFKIYDRLSSDPSKCFNGGDYHFGRILKLENDTVVGGRFWTSAEFDYCPMCGRFVGPSDHHQHFEKFFEGDVFLEGELVEELDPEEVKGIFYPVRK